MHAGERVKKVGGSHSGRFLLPYGAKCRVLGQGEGLSLGNKSVSVAMFKLFSLSGQSLSPVNPETWARQVSLPTVVGNLRP